MTAQVWNPTNRQIHKIEYLSRHVGWLREDGTIDASHLPAGEYQANVYFAELPDAIPVFLAVSAA